MANLVWTSILYISTIGIVYLIYRVFVADRKAEGERKTREMISRSYGGAPMPPMTGKSASAPAAARFPLKPQPKSKLPAPGRLSRF